jgi:hypothetical protein
MLKRESRPTADALGPEDRADFYRDALTAVQRARIRFMIGGAYAMERYTGIVRRTKDIDVFVRPRDVERSLQALGAAGFGTELTDPSWLAKAFHEDYFMDIIFSSGNGLCPVDDEVLAHAPSDRVLGMRVKLFPPEETVWSKAFIMERERFDGADIAHIIRARGREMDWGRLMRRMEAHWQVLLTHCILFRYIYPGERDAIPEWVMKRLLDRARRDNDPQAGERICRGTLLSRYQYLTDLEEWGYVDARPLPLALKKTA